MLSFPEEPRILNLRTCSTNSSGRSFASIVSRKVRRTSRLDTTMLALDLLAVLQHNARRATVSDENLVDGSAAADLPPLASSDAASACVTAPMPPRAKPQAPTAPSMFPM